MGRKEAEIRRTRDMEAKRSDFKSAKEAAAAKQETAGTSGSAADDKAKVDKAAETAGAAVSRPTEKLSDKPVAKVDLAVPAQPQQPEVNFQQLLQVVIRNSALLAFMLSLKLGQVVQENIVQLPDDEF